jgi:uncharacterized phage-associated protein
MVYPAKLIAYAFVKRGIEDQKPVTQMQLQKMVYFAHGYHLAKHNQPLVEEIFEAWKFGPVIRSIYDEFKSFGNIPITEIDKAKSQQVSKLSPSAKDSIEFTWATTKHLSAAVLSNWTHKTDSPWGKVYRPNIWSIPIMDSSIKEYFSNLLKTAS